MRELLSLVTRHWYTVTLASRAPRAIVQISVIPYYLLGATYLPAMELERKSLLPQLPASTISTSCFDN